MNFLCVYYKLFSILIVFGVPGNYYYFYTQLSRELNRCHEIAIVWYCFSLRLQVFLQKGYEQYNYISGEQEDKNIKKGVVDGPYQIVFFTPEVLLLNKQRLNL